MRNFVETDQTLRQAFTPPVSDSITAVVVTSSSQAVAIPAGARFVVFSLDGDFYAKFGTSNAVVAAEPTATGANGAELSPAQRRLDPTHTHIALVSPNGAKGSLSFYG